MDNQYESLISRETLNIWFLGIAFETGLTVLFEGRLELLLMDRKIRKMK
jgi:hypothetical protein